MITGDGKTTDQVAVIMSDVVMSQSRGDFNTFASAIQFCTLYTNSDCGGPWAYHPLPRPGVPVRSTSRSKPRIPAERVRPGLALPYLSSLPRHVDDRFGFTSKRELCMQC